jgi:Tfp pilus assembly protein PilZ
MNTLPIGRIPLASRKTPERRDSNRDRRILEGTMKYMGEFLTVEVLNVSENGAYVVAPVMPSMTDSVTIAINLPELGGSVMVAGRVRRVTIGSRVLQRPGGFGIQFTRYYTPVGQSILREHLAA